jgi:hypothetical protein
MLMGTGADLRAIVAVLGVLTALTVGLGIEQTIDDQTQHQQSDNNDMRH